MYLFGRGSLSANIFLWRHEFFNEDLINLEKNYNLNYCQVKFIKQNLIKLALNIIYLMNA